MLNLDTHVLLYALSGRLKPKQHELLGSHDWSISAIVHWEICKLAQLGRVEIEIEDADVVRTLRRIHTWPLTWDICRQSTQLDVRGDPADELIAATSIVHRIPLVTQDRVLLRSKMIPFPSKSVDA